MTRDKLPTGTLTFLFTDIEGSTRLLVQLGERFPEVLETHQRLLRKAFRTGHEVGTEGDSFFVAFPSAVDAVLAAVAAQRALASHAWPEGVSLRIRIGVHTGEGSLGGDNYVGLDVHRAARIKAIAHGGQVLLSDATRGLVAGHLPVGVDLRDLGEHRLRDLVAPERLHQLVIADLPSAFPPPSTLATRPNNLPRPLTELHGRDDERREIAEILAGAPLVTLTGPGGVGKSRLAVEVARDSMDAYPDGAFLVPLEDLDEAAHVSTAVARTLGILDAGPEAIEPRLAGYLADRRMLVILDNMEHVLDAAGSVSRMLGAAPNLTVLVTSRSRLRVAGEHEYPVAPLPVARASAGSAAEVMAAAAVAMFAERARAALPGFVVTDENAATIAAICARLDGLPLAIELAASSVRSADPVQILQMLSAHLELPGESPRDLPARQATLQATIEWSYGLLTQTAARFLNRLSAFGGSFDVDAASIVANPGGELEPVTLVALSRLVEQSLLVAESAHGAPRYRMLQTVRAVAASRLAASGKRDEIVARHRAYFAALAAELAPHLTRVGMMPAFARLDDEYENVREAMVTALDGGAVAEAIDIGWSMWRYWAHRGHISEGRTLIERALTAKAAAPRGAVRARAQLSLASLAYWQGDLAAFRAAITDAVDCAREAGDPALEVEAKADLAWSMGLDQLDRAQELFEEAVALAEASGLDDLVLLCRVGLAQLLFYRGNVDLAEGRLLAVLADLEAAGEISLQAVCYGQLGQIARLRGDLRSAFGYWRQALRLQSLAASSPTAGIGLGFAAHAIIDVDPLLAVRLTGTSSAVEIQHGTRVPWEEMHLTYPPDAVRTTHPVDVVEAAFEEGKRLSVGEALEMLEAAIDRYLDRDGDPAPGPDVQSSVK